MNKKESAAPEQGDQQQSKAKNNTELSVSLSDNQLSKILNYYAQHHPRANQAQRFIEAMARNPDSPTNRLNKGGGVNLSQVARINNPRLKKFGYFIRCRVPSVPIKNSFGEKSAQELWGICQVAG